jgi:hypothetical protein
MMTDYTELKRLAEAAIKQHGDWVAAGEPWPVWNSFLMELYAAANPAAVLALIAESERLSAACTRAEQVINAESKAAAIATGRANLMQTEREQLKAENETLVAAAKALRDEWRKDQVDAKRHRFARDCAYGALTLMEGKRVFVELDYPEGEFSGCGQAYEIAIDAAMGKGEQS